MLFFIAISVLFSTTWAACSLGGYSLDALAGKKLTAPDDGGSWEYDFQMCGDFETCKGKQWWAVQSSVTDQTCQSGLGTWAGASLTPSANSVIIAASDGADCVGTPRKITITLTCDPSTDFKPNSAGEQGQCNYVVSANSKCACSTSACSGSTPTTPTTKHPVTPTTGPPPPPPDSGKSTAAAAISGGTIFLIALGGAIFLYCIGGCVWNGKKNGDWKDVKTNTPHLRFWCAIPIYAKTGCVVTYEKLRGLCNRKGGGDTGYDEIE